MLICLFQQEHRGASSTRVVVCVMKQILLPCGHQKVLTLVRILATVDVELLSIPTVVAEASDIPPMARTLWLRVEGDINRL